MNGVRPWIWPACGLVLTTFLCWTLEEAHALLVDTRAAVRQIQPILQNANDATERIRDLSATFNEAAQAETGKLQASTEELRKTERSSRAAIDSFRQILISVRQDSLPRLNLALDDLDKSELQIAANFSETLQHAEPLLDNLSADAADPHVKEAIANLDAAAHDLDADLAQLRLILESGTATARDVQAVADKVAEQYTKARNLYYSVFKELLGIGSQGIQFWLKK